MCDEGINRIDGISRKLPTIRLDLLTGVTKGVLLCGLVATGKFCLNLVFETSSGRKKMRSVGFSIDACNVLLVVDNL